MSGLNVVAMFCHLLLLFPVFHFVWITKFIFCKSGVHSQTSCVYKYIYMSDNEHVNYILITFLYKIENFCLFGQMFVVVLHMIKNIHSTNDVKKEFTVLQKLHKNMLQFIKNVWLQM